MGVIGLLWCIACAPNPLSKERFYAAVRNSVPESGYDIYTKFKQAEERIRVLEEKLEALIHPPPPPPTMPIAKTTWLPIETTSWQWHTEKLSEIERAQPCKWVQYGDGNIFESGLRRECVDDEVLPASILALHDNTAELRTAELDAARSRATLAELSRTTGRFLSIVSPIKAPDVVAEDQRTMHEQFMDSALACDLPSSDAVDRTFDAIGASLKDINDKLTPVAKEKASSWEAIKVEMQRQDREPITGVLRVTGLPVDQDAVQLKELIARNEVLQAQLQQNLQRFDEMQQRIDDEKRKAKEWVEGKVHWPEWWPTPEAQYHFFRRVLNAMFVLVGVASLFSEKVRDQLISCMIAFAMLKVANRLTVHEFH